MAKRRKPKARPLIPIHVWAADQEKFDRSRPKGMTKAGHFHRVLAAYLRARSVEEAAKSDANES